MNRADNSREALQTTSLSRVCVNLVATFIFAFGLLAVGTSRSVHQAWMCQFITIEPRFKGAQSAWNVEITIADYGHESPTRHVTMTARSGRATIELWDGYLPKWRYGFRRRPSMADTSAVSELTEGTRCEYSSSGCFV